MPAPFLRSTLATRNGRMKVSTIQNICTGRIYLQDVYKRQDRYMLREFSSKKAFVSQRVEALNREVEEAGAQAVIFATNIYEEAASWDYPSQRNSLEEKGIKTISYEQLQYPLGKNEGLKDKVSAFADSLKGGNH